MERNPVTDALFSRLAKLRDLDVKDPNTLRDLGERTKQVLHPKFREADQLQAIANGSGLFRIVK